MRDRLALAGLDLENGDRDRVFPQELIQSACARRKLGGLRERDAQVAFGKHDRLALLSLDVPVERTARARSISIPKPGRAGRWPRPMPA